LLGAKTILKTKTFLVKVKLFFQPPDLTNYPFFLFTKPKLLSVEQFNKNYRYAVFLFKKNVEVQLSNTKYFLNFFRNSLVIFKKNNPTTITRNLGVKLDNNNSNGKKLLVIYIDGLSSFVNEESNILKYLMPETYNFFSKSNIYENYYGIGEWTLPNYASLMTGTLQNSHGYIYSAKKRNKANEKITHPLIHEYLSEAGLITNVISAVPYVNPNFKFHFGTENFFFSKNMNSEGILDLFQYSEAQFKHHNVTWLHFMDVHHKLRGISDLDYEPSSRLIDEMMANYRFSKKDAVNFATRAIQLDFSLAKLFKMESTNKYENIILVSDHGSTRLNTDWEKCLDDARAKTTLMVKSRNQKEVVYVKGLTTHLSFIEIVCKLLEIKIPTIKNTELENIIVIQSIYEDKPYRARLKGPGIDFNFVGSKSSGIKPYVNLIDIDNLLNNSTLKSLSKVQQLNLKKLLLGG
jgi:hypothetical protein